MEEEEFWGIEREFWLAGRAFYEEHLDPACLMVFPGTGILGTSEVLDALDGAPRWSSVAMTERMIGRPSDAMTVLAYRAEGRRAGAGPYRCWCMSTYRRAQDRWRLAQHQQTVVE